MPSPTEASQTEPLRGRDRDIASPLAFRIALGLAAATPLVALPGLGDAPRALLLRAAAVLVAVTVAWSWPSRATRLVAAALVAWVGSHAASAVTSIDPVISLWGTPDARLGLATVVAAALVALGAARAPHTALRWSATGCVAASLLGATVPELFPHDGGLGWCALTATALSGWLAVDARSRAWALAAVGCLSIALFAGGAAAQTGAWLGGAVALAVIRDEVPLTDAARRWVTGAFALLLSAPLVIVAAPAYEIIGSALPARGALDRLTAHPELFEHGQRWSAALETATLRPSLGTGGGCFSYAWDYICPSRVFDAAPTAADATDAANTFLHALAERGGIGALTEFLLLAAAFVTVTRRRRRGELDAAAATALAGLVVARAGHGLLAVPDVTGLATTAVMLGLVAGHGGAAAYSAPRALSRRIVMGTIVALLAVAPPSLSIWFAAQPPETFATQPHVMLDPLGAHVRRRTAARVPDALTAESADALIDAARDELLRRLDATERDVRATRAFGRLAVAAHLLRDRDDLVAPARAALERALGWASTRTDLSTLNYDLARAAGDVRAANEWAEDALTMSPGWPEAIWRAADDLARSGDRDAAREIIEQALASGVVFSGRGRAVAEALRE